MERAKLEKQVFKREVELKKTLPNAFIRICDLYLPGPLCLNSYNDFGDLLLLQIVRQKKVVSMSNR